MLYAPGRTYYHAVKSDGDTYMSDSPAFFPNFKDSLFFFKESTREVYSYGGHFLATVVDESGNPCVYRRKGYSLKSFTATGTSLDYRLIVNVESSTGAFSMVFHNNARFGNGLYGVPPLDYDKEWIYPARTIIQMIDELDEWGEDNYNAIVFLRRRKCLLDNTIKYENDKLKNNSEICSFFTNCLEEEVFLQPQSIGEGKDNAAQYITDRIGPIRSEIQPSGNDSADSAIRILIQQNNEQELLLRSTLEKSSEKKEILSHYRESLLFAKVKEGTEYIPFDQFSYCKSLTELTIPDSVNKIGNSAFNNSSLEKIRFLSPIAPKLLWGFPQPGKPYCKARIIIPRGSLSNYQGKSMWEYLENQLEEDI